MIDQYGRDIDYLRVSVTDRCNLRCVYCMPAEGVPPVAHADILTFEEIVRICRCAAGLGLRHIKLTGGEPLVRRGVVKLVRALRELEGVEQVTMTTNGILLGEQAQALKQAGLDAVNVSLDTLDQEEFSRITRGGRLQTVLDSIDRALDAGLRLKLNCVPAGSGAEEQVPRLAELARLRPIDVRFIELMPLGLGSTAGGLSGDRVCALREKSCGRLAPCSGRLGNGPAVYVQAEGFAGRFGLIRAISHKFCKSCNRVRLTPTGFLKLCLQYDLGVDLRSQLRSGIGDAQLTALLRETIAQKPAGHQFGMDQGAHLEQRGMSEIGG